MTLNGHNLTKQEVTALKTTITCFRMSLTKEIIAPSACLTEHKHVMLVIANGFETHLAQISRLLTEG